MTQATTLTGTVRGKHVELDQETGLADGQRVSVVIRQKPAVGEALCRAFVPVDETIAEHFGKVRATMFGQGLVVAKSDLLIAVTALHLDYAVVSHNARHFAMMPGLRFDDWLN